MRDLLALFRGKKGVPKEAAGAAPPPSNSLSSVGREMTVQAGFQEDIRTSEPILRLSRQEREQLGIEVGGYVQVRRQGHKIPVRVEVSAAGDAGEEICRLNPLARTLLEADIGDKIEIIPPETLLLMIDISGSMNDNLGWGKTKLQATRSAIEKLLDNKSRENENDLVGVIAFETDTHLVAKPTIRYDSVQERVSQLYAEGGTALFEGLEYSLKILLTAPGLRRILLLTDGVPTTTPEGPILEKALEAKSSLVVIDTVGVGSAGKKVRYDETLLRKIASLTGGRFIHVDDVQGLEESFLMLGSEKKIPLLLSRDGNR